MPFWLSDKCRGRRRLIRLRPPFVMEAEQNAHRHREMLLRASVRQLLQRRNPRQTPSFGTAGISLTKHRINAILIHGRRARYVRFCRSGFSAAQSGKRSGAGLRRDVEAAFLTRPAIIQFLDKMVCNRFVICGICRK